YVFSRLEFGDANQIILQQLRGAVFGLALLIICARLDYHRWRTWSVPVFAVALAALVATHIPGIGHEQNGASRWIQIGSLPPITPSEFMKPAIIIYLAAWLSSRPDKVKRFT